MKTRKLPPEERPRACVIGVGAFGRNHARVYHELAKAGLADLCGVFDSDAARARAAAAEFRVPAFASLEELLEKVRPQAASVAVPTVAHLETARALMHAGVDVLIEKPLASNLAEADELIRLAKQGNRIAQVGQLERFNPAVRAVLPLITRPMFFEVHRLSVFTPRSLDVDVILDLMIHDLDVVLAFVNSPVKEVRAVGLPVLTAKVDIANVRMEFDSGCVANFTASRVSTERVRKLRFFQPRQYVSIDYTRQEALLFDVSGASASNASFAAMEAAGQHPSSPQIKINKPKISREEPLKAELAAFLGSVRNRSAPVVTLEDGRRALAAAHEILAKINEHSRKLNLAAVR